MLILPAIFRSQASYLVEQNDEEQGSGYHDSQNQTINMPGIRELNHILNVAAPAEVNGERARCRVKKAVRLIKKSFMGS